MLDLPPLPQLLLLLPQLLQAQQLQQPLQHRPQPLQRPQRHLQLVIIFLHVIFELFPNSYFFFFM